MLGCKKFYCWLLVLIMLFAVMILSGGCGGGSSGGGYVPPDNNNDVPNMPDNPDNPDNPPDNPIDDNDDENGNNSPAVPTEINGTWVIESGWAVISEYYNGKVSSIGLTYKPGRMGELGINFAHNSETIYSYGPYKDKYSLTLSGENVIGSGVIGAGYVYVDFSYNDYPEESHQLLFSGNIGYRLINNTTYEMTNDDLDNSIVNNINEMIFFTSTVTLIDSETLRWTYWSTDIDDTFIGMNNFDMEFIQELTFKKAR